MAVGRKQEKVEVKGCLELQGLCRRSPGSVMAGRRLLLSPSDPGQSRPGPSLPVGEVRMNSEWILAGLGAWMVRHCVSSHLPTEPESQHFLAWGPEKMFWVFMGFLCLMGCGPEPSSSPLGPFLVVVGIEPRASGMLGKGSIT
jgi:hypothetical protein